MKVASTELQKTNFENLFQVAVGSLSSAMQSKTVGTPQPCSYFWMNNLKNYAITYFCLH